MTTSIPTLSSIGWVSTIEKKADYVLSTFITCNHSQSILFAGNTTSLQYLIKRYAGKQVEFQEQLYSVLDNLMTAAFKDATVDVTVDVTVPDELKPTELWIRFNCVITVEGVAYTVGKLVQSIDSKITQIKALNAG